YHLEGEAPTLVSKEVEITWANLKEGLYASLKEHLRVDVQALKPTSLSAAVGLARLYEAKYHSQQLVS
ncbi:MDIS1-interacting receptor like kinase 2-like, partial [Fagus crenata]